MPHSCRPFTAGLCRGPAGALTLAALLLCAGLAPTEAGATVVVLHDLDEMTARAEIVVHARVAEQRVIREGGRIVTLTDIEVIDGLKGARAGEVMTVYQVGGTLDGQSQQIVGSHSYETGEQMVLFAMRHGQRIVSYGVGVGKFRVEEAEDGVRVVEELGDVMAMRRGADGKPRVERPTPRTPRTLEAFKREVAGHVARPPVKVDRPQHQPRLKPHQLKRLTPEKARSEEAGDR